MPASTVRRPTSKGLTPAQSRHLRALLLLHRCLAALNAWELRYGDARPAPLWLPPARLDSLRSDLSAFLAFEKE